MATIDENELAALLLETCKLRAVEPNIYSVLPDNESGNEYDSQFGFIYDLVACNPIYNRLIWGYSVKIFSQTASEALHSSHDGHVLDIGCGSLATTLVKNNRLADKYLEALADSGKLVSRAVGDHEKVFEQVGLSAKYETTGNILVIIGNK